MFSIVTAASDRKLTTLETVKDELGITGSSEDAKLGRMIERVSAMICNYIGVPAASNGSVTLGLETVSEVVPRTPWYRGGGPVLLSRRPVVTIVSVGVGDAVIDPADYELDPGAAMLRRTGVVATFDTAATPGLQTVIVYEAGWTLPPAENYTLPPDIEGAAIGLIRSARYAAMRDPAVKAEQTTDIERVEYWVGQIGQNGAIPPDIASVLDPYCYEPVL